MKQQFCLINDNVKHNVVRFIQSLPVDHRSPLIIEAREESRTDKQNRLMWPLLKDLSDQVVWHGEKLEPAEWKDLITVLVSQMQNPEHEQKSAPGYQRRPRLLRRSHLSIKQALHGRGDRGDLLVRHRAQCEVQREVQQSDCMGPGMEGFACTVCSLRSWSAASSACLRAASARSKLSLQIFPLFTIRLTWQMSAGCAALPEGKLHEHLSTH